MKKVLYVMDSFFPMKNVYSLKYARHNEKACRYLDKKLEFTDWVITTAFYSSLHYVRYKIFPIQLERNGKRIQVKNFEQYYRINNPLQRSKHELLSDLVEEKYTEIAVDYNKLRDISWTARYSNYRYPREISNDAKKSLERIRDFCTKEK